MPDMSPTIIAKSNQLNSDDLIGTTKTIRITNVSAVPGDQPIAINYEGDNGKPYMPCKSMRRVLVQVWGSDGKSYIGKTMTLYRDPGVTFGGIAVGGIRISHMSGITAPMQMALTERRGAKKAYTVQPLAVPPPVASPAKVSDLEALKEAATIAASSGTDALKGWFEELSNQDKAAIKPLLGEYKALAEKAGEVSFDDDGVITDDIFPGDKPNKSEQQGVNA